MKNILIPIDFSAASRQAAEYASALTQVFEARLHLLHVYNELVPVTIGPEPWTGAVSDYRKENEDLIKREVDYLRSKYPIQVEGQVRIGFKSDSIKDMAKEINADLIVLGLASGEKNHPGSTVFKTIRKTNTPILIIPGEASYVPMKNIVLAVDFNEMTYSTGLEILTEFMEKYDSSLRVLHVEKKGADLKAGEVAEKLQLGVVLSKFNYIYDKMEFDNVEEGIEKFVDEHPTDLLVMIAHHHNLMERLFGRVHTKAIGRDVKMPILVVRNK